MTPRFSSPSLSGSALALALLATGLAAAPLEAQETAGRPLSTDKRFPAEVTVAQGTGTKTIALKKAFRLEGVTGQVVRFDTRLGNIYVQMLPADAPKHVANFLAYADAGSYGKSFFDRSVSFSTTSTDKAIIQGGGYVINGTGTAVTPITALAPVVNEYKDANARGTLAAARSLASVDSATSAWYFNVQDNSTLLDAENSGGFTVFGRAVGENSFAVMDAIAAVPVPATGASAPFDSTPLIDHAAGTSPQISELVTVNSVTVVPLINPVAGQPGLLRLRAASSNPALVTPSIVGNKLTLVFDPSQSGEATVTVKAKGLRGGTAKRRVHVTVTAR